MLLRHSFVIRWHVSRYHPVCSAEEQCFPKAGRIHVLIQRNGGMVNHFKLLITYETLKHGLCCQQRCCCCPIME